MEPPKKEIRIQITPPPAEPLNLPLEEPKSLPGFYWILLVLTFLFSAAGIYLSFFA